MHIDAWIQWIAETYSVEPEHPWLQYPDYTVFRQVGNRKWFAVVMEIPKEKLQPGQTGTMHILNVKCDPVWIGAFGAEPGIYPAYHMNKENWRSLALDGSVDTETVKVLLDMSYRLTAPKRRGRGN